MRRKIIQLAGKTLVVSLPSKWVKSSGVRKGDEVELIESGHGFLIAPVETKISLKSVIDVSGLNSSLVWHYLTSAYVKGIEEIDVRFSGAEIMNPRTKKTVKTIEFIGDVVSSLIGMELVRYGSNFCIVKEVSELKKGEFDTVLKRLFFTVCTFSADVVNAINERDIGALRNCAELEKTVNRLCLFCWRAVSKGVFSTSVETVSFYSVVFLLEEIADVYARICELDEKIIKIAELRQSLQGSAQVVKELYDIFYDFDKKKISEFYARCRELKEQSVEKKFRYSAVIADKCTSISVARIVLSLDVHTLA
ncbi:phosphate uptake regulator PhoU [Candidatus Woesearchaeota archaeon]|nr:phosphate uptake regulator PhoU [Candidatus Woesearchaeota archaeon]